MWGACVGVYQLLNWKNALWNTEKLKTNLLYSDKQQETPSGISSIYISFKFL